MEKVKIKEVEYEIKNIDLQSNLLKIVFAEAVDLSDTDCSSIDVYTGGGIKCSTIEGYSTIYKADENVIILSNDGSIYSDTPLPADYELSDEDITRIEISKLKVMLSETDYKVIKCIEYQLAGLDLPYDIVALNAERQAVRDQINALELTLTA
ncbi:hypothetical protein HMPREF0322_00387 [Desulfitobacterium hafniense DP7]|uniref:Uncharacterized protein n=1 Tax=Desulfitobacterium hafniense DP7 TaxID=537010 RepID=G9XHG2_DESHA|nr:hypothetical protein [Desulfitobacterium hafniense]EHL08964.1 hypothetical protein HMPREF0322_00387 [Desulfitobacterium hafniense DP7]